MQHGDHAHAEKRVHDAVSQHPAGSKEAFDAGVAEIEKGVQQVSDALQAHIAAGFKEAQKAFDHLKANAHQLLTGRK